jgi:hypothetical protein
MFSSHQPIGGILIYFYVCGIPFTQTCSSRCSKMPEAGPSCRQQAPTEVEMEVVEAPTSKEFRNREGSLWAISPRSVGVFLGEDPR